MKLRLKALLKELRENSGYCFHCSSNIELSIVKRLIKKHWPAEAVDIDAEKLNNPIIDVYPVGKICFSEPKRKRNRTQKEAAISSGCSLHIYKKRFDAMKTKNNWPASWSSPEFENWPTLQEIAELSLRGKK